MPLCVLNVFSFEWWSYKRSNTMSIRVFVCVLCCDLYIDYVEPLYRLTCLQNRFCCCCFCCCCFFLSYSLSCSCIECGARHLFPLEMLLLVVLQTRSLNVTVIHWTESLLLSCGIHCWNWMFGLLCGSPIWRLFELQNKPSQTIVHTLTYDLFAVWTTNKQIFSIRSNKWTH